MTSPGTSSPTHAGNPQGLRILWVNCRLLHPLNGGDRIRTYNMLKELKRKHFITYACFRTVEDTEDVVARSTEFCHELITVPYRAIPNGSLKFFAGVLANSLWGNIPFFAEKYRSKEMRRRIRELVSSGTANLIVADYLASMVQLTELNVEPRTPILILQHNVESQIWKRHYETEVHPVKRAIYRRQWRMTRRWECSCATLADGQVAVSEDDCRFLRERLGMNNVLGTVPTGVDANYFAPSPEPRQPRSLAFLGAMDWMANIDGVLWFAKEILPAVRARFPDTTLTIVGRNPSAPVLALAKADSRVHVTGTVDDVRPYIARAKVMIVPLRVGSGTRIKIYEGMATGIPVVSTSIGAEGLSVSHGENILLADSPSDFADRVCELLERSDLACAIGGKGLALARRLGGWATVGRVFEQYCWQVGAQAKDAN